MLVSFYSKFKIVVNSVTVLMITDRNRPTFSFLQDRHEYYIWYLEVISSSFATFYQKLESYIFYFERFLYIVIDTQIALIDLMFQNRAKKKWLSDTSSIPTKPAQPLCTLAFFPTRHQTKLRVPAGQQNTDGFKKICFSRQGQQKRHIPSTHSITFSVLWLIKFFLLIVLIPN